jgi:CRISPR/Cas system CSM-associated protein Csm3 (group 7 of RAMP superfamily)
MMTSEKRTYFKIIYTLESPLTVGTANNAKTEHDVALNGDGDPIIPATAIAGVYRHLLLLTDPEQAKELFGYVVVKTAKDETGEKPRGGLSAATPNADSANEQEASADTPAHKQSRLLFYDAELAELSYHKSIRDAVKLDLYKTSLPGYKYDFEIIEPGINADVQFVAYIEACDEEAAKEMHGLLCNTVGFGAKTTRGYGRVTTKWSAKQFNLGEPKERTDWLEFDVFESFDDERFSPYAKPHLEGMSNQQTGITIIELKLKQKGALSIRQYSTEIQAGNTEAYDYQYLALTDDTPVIPGTSWAGMFRKNMADLLDNHSHSDGPLAQAMGWVTEKKPSAGSEQNVQARSEDKPNAVKSKIRFSESKIIGCETKIITRNAIDRYSGGTKDGALYTEKTIYNGTTDLRIEIEEGVDRSVLQALAASIIDLHWGFIALGGLTSVGRGLFEFDPLESNHLIINGEAISLKDKQPSDAFNCLVEKVVKL